MTTEEKQNRVCEAALDHAWAHSSFVKFMVDHMKKAGCPIERRHFQCAPCDLPILGGFEQDKGVVLCQNNVQTQTQVHDTLTHELIHAFDFCRAKVSWDNCEHHACTEIRAANLSGDCMFTKEFDRGRFGVAAHQQECVKRRAILSVQGNPKCADRAAEVVEKVFETCFNDTAPFERIP